MRSPDHPISPPHPAFFQLLLQIKHFRYSTLGSPLGDAWASLASRLGHPRATQSQTQSQSAEGRNFLMPRGAKIAAQQTVIVSDRRSREPNDLDQAKPDRQLLIAICFCQRPCALRRSPTLAQFMPAITRELVHLQRTCLLRPSA